MHFIQVEVYGEVADHTLVLVDRLYELVFLVRVIICFLNLVELSSIHETFHVSFIVLRGAELILDVLPRLSHLHYAVLRQQFSLCVVVGQIPSGTARVGPHGDFGCGGPSYIRTCRPGIVQSPVAGGGAGHSFTYRGCVMVLLFFQLGLGTLPRLVFIHNLIYR